MDAEELTEWAAYAQLDPFGGLRGDYQAAIIASTVVNAQAGKTCTKVKDFMPQFGPPMPAPSMSPQEIHARLSVMFRRAPHA